ncbi:MAG: TonB-dependent receptor, partial [Pseudomonadota bacterium]
LSQDDTGEREAVTLRGALSWEPISDFSAVPKYTYNDNRIGTFLVDDAALQRERFDFSNDENPERSQFNSVTLRMACDLTENISLESETTYFRDDFLQPGDIDRTALPQEASRRQRDFENIEQEVRLSYDSDDPRATVGVFLTRFERDATGDVLLPGFSLIPIAPPASEVTVRSLTVDKVTNFAGFGEVEYDLVPELTLIAGMRYDIESVESMTTSSFLSDDPTLSLFLPPPSDAEAHDADFGAFLPKAGLVYSFNQDLNLAFTAQRGYRAGGASRQASSGEVVACVRNLFDNGYATNRFASLSGITAQSGEPLTVGPIGQIRF